MPHSSRSTATPDGNATTAMPRAARILAGLIGNMSIELRLIEAADVLYDGTPDDAGSGMCFDWFTPRMLITGEGHERHELLSQFMPLFPPFQRHSVHRRAQLVRFHRRPRADHVRSHGFADLAPQAQAAAIVARFKRSTCPPRMLIPYVTIPSLEIERRTADTHAGRLEPLLADNWRSAFPALANLWPDEVAEMAPESGAAGCSRRS